MSVFHRVRWPWRDALAGRCEAWQPPWRRHRSRHLPPQRECQCGIYASTLATASTYVPTSPSRTHGRYPVIGTVALWGDVIEHTGGWRASFAYPTRLFVLHAGVRRAEQARRTAEALERYGVPVDVIEAWNPQDVVTALAEATALEADVVTDLRRAG
jgi:hypothetical protein